MEEIQFIEGKEVFSKVGIAFFLLLILTEIMGPLFYIVMEQSGIQEIVGKYHLDLFLTQMPMYLVAVPISIFVLKGLPAHGKPEEHSWKMSRLFACFCICIGTMYLGNIIGQALMTLIGVLKGGKSENLLENVVMDTNIWGILLIVVLIGPILEEYLCRKVLLDRINQYGQGISVLVSGLIFGLIHGNFYQFFYAFGLGAIFAYIYVKTGKWKYPVVFHILINFMGSVVPLFFIRRLETVLSDDMSKSLGEVVLSLLLLLPYAVMIIGLIITGIVLLFCFRKEIVFSKGSICIEKGKQFQMIFVNVGMILLFVTCGILFGISTIMS
ncbi:MAG: CPBP family intramembrane metalloprotease [Lachnospiraceae bacterium]|nr:CPBP family intramembrane metalloprotease [Lachnospiraceae bacterium]